MKLYVSKIIMIMENNKFVMQLMASEIRLFIQLFQLSFIILYSKFSKK